MVDIVLLGVGGRMGHVLARLIAERDDCRVVAGIDTNDALGLPFPIYNKLEDMQEKADVLIDFSHPQAIMAALPVCAARTLPCVVCTTGLGEDVKQAMQQVSAKTAVFYSANMSLGINLLATLAKQAQAALPGFDIEIIEKHHHNKLDAPSGTALLLADAINEQAEGRYQYVYNRQPLRQKRGADEIGISAVRAGSIVGEHEVLFAGPDEVINLSHIAYSREVFANGAIAAAVFIAGKAPGMYTMQNMLEKE